MAFAHLEQNIIPYKDAHLGPNLPRWLRRQLICIRQCPIRVSVRTLTIRTIVSAWFSSVPLGERGFSSSK